MVNASLFAADALTLNGLLVPSLRPAPIPEAVAVIVLLPARVMTRSSNVAFPVESVLRVSVPPAKPPGTDTVIGTLFDERLLPN